MEILCKYYGVTMYHTKDTMEFLCRYYGVTTNLLCRYNVADWSYHGATMDTM